MSDGAGSPPRPWAEMSEPLAGPLPDHGPTILDQMQQQLMMDDEWVTRTGRTLTWWGGPLPMRITVSEPRPSFGDPTIKVTATCTILESTTIEFDGACEMLSGLNMLNAGSCLWVDPSGGSVHGTVTHYAHRGNQAILDNGTFALLVLMNYGSCLGKAAHLEEMLGGIQPRPAHPISGTRADYDELTSYPDRAAMEGQRRNLWTVVGLDGAAEWFRGQGLLATDDDVSLTVELPFSSSIPALEQAALGVAAGGMTALYQQQLDEPHPFAGQGLLSLLELPIPPDGTGASVLANGLNWSEVNELCGFPLWGGWIGGPNNQSLTHALFCPSVMAKPGLSMTIGFYSMLRTLWAQERILSHEVVDRVRRGDA